MTFDQDLRITAMTLADLDTVVAAEATLHASPWTRGQFADSLAAGHDVLLAYDSSNALVGYGVVMMAVGEADLLNISVLPAFQRQGVGAAFLQHLMARARMRQVTRMLLEVRATNRAALALYTRQGFIEVGRRHGYYPAHEQREDAIVMAREL
ncbi:MAG: ribosomal protein S18-alanine N-acetyltransferase [Rugosibacter sp.]|jgi:ribosomal-protein-alanine N-acetyltransferase|nr:ribosomal protein S18-alanine N-acetyltransferase [Rugosibacter sp.]